MTDYGDELGDLLHCVWGTLGPGYFGTSGETHRWAPDGLIGERFNGGKYFIEDGNTLLGSKGASGT